MERILEKRKVLTFSSLSLIFICFLLTSIGYLSWLYHMMDILPASISADQMSEVYGYLCQAAGLLIFTLALRFRPSILGRTVYIIVVITYILLLIPAVIAANPALVLLFGFLSNLVCGLLSGYYLYVLTFMVEDSFRAGAFGLAYGLSSIALWLLTIRVNFLHMDAALIFYSLLAIVSAGIYRGICHVCGGSFAERDFFDKYPNRQGKEQSEETFENLPDGRGKKQFGSQYEISSDGQCKKRFGSHYEILSDRPMNAEDGEETDHPFSAGSGLLLLAAATVILLSLVKNLAFAFPAADIHAGISLELARIFYGGGLILAGFVSDKKRNLGAIFCLAALVVPFAMLALSGKGIPVLILWILNYFFFGFFSVFRVVLFTDLAAKSSSWAGRLKDQPPYYWMAGCGLLFGRIGDAAGTWIHLAMNNNLYILVIIAASLFILTVFLFFCLYHEFYIKALAPGPEEKEKSQQEVFEEFASQYQCSQRERDVLRCILQEQSNSEIADSLYITESTVKFHIHNLLKKTGCRNRIELLAVYHAGKPGKRV